MSTRARVWAAFLAVYILWGSTYLAIRLAVATIPPYLMAGARHLFAGLILFAWIARRGPPRMTRREWRDAAIVGGLMLLGGNGIVSWAEQYVPSGVTALLVSTIAIWVALLDWLWLKQPRPNRTMFAGLALGVAGVALLVHPDVSSASGAAWLVGALAELVAAAFWAAGTVYSRRAVRPRSPLLGAAMQMVAGGILILLTGTLTGEWSRLDLARVTTASWLSLGYLIFFGSIIGLTSFLWLVQVTTPAKAATNVFVNPVVAVILGWAVAGEEVRPLTIVAAVVALSGVVMIVRGRGAQAR